MLQDIKFCSCSELGKDDMLTRQCMIFRFTPRAMKMLSDDFLDKISTIDENIESTEHGIPLSPDDDKNNRFFKIQKLEK